MSSSSRIPPASYVVDKFGSYYAAVPGSPNQTYIAADTNPSTLINAAITAGSHVFIKKNTYPLPSKLSLKSNLHFNCEPGTVFTNNNAFSTVDLYEGVLDAHGTLASPITNLHVRGPQIEVTGRDTDGITYEHVNDGTISDVIVKGFTGTQALEEGIQIAGCHRVSARNIFVDSMGSIGQASFEIGGHLTSFEPSTDIYLDNYHAKTPGDTGLDITACNMVIARNCRIDTPAALNLGGIRIYSNPTTSMPQTKNILLDGGEVNSSLKNGFRIFGRLPGVGGGEVENVTIRSYIVRGCINRGILIGQNCRRIRIESSLIDSNGTTDDTATAGIETAPAVVNDISEIQIVWCVISNNSRPATPTNRRPGIMIFQTNRVLAEGNILFGNGGDGAQFNRVTNFIFIGNLVYNNSFSSSGNSNGVQITSTSGVELSDEGIVTNNRCYDDQGTKNQAYGVGIGSVNCKNILVTNNDLRGNKTGAVNNFGDPSCVIGANLGFNPVASGAGLNFIAIEATTKAGAPVDADFTNPRDGLVVADTTNNRIYTRIGGVWKSVVVA